MRNIDPVLPGNEFTVEFLKRKRLMRKLLKLNKYKITSSFLNFLYIILFVVQIILFKFFYKIISLKIFALKLIIRAIKRLYFNKKNFKN